MAEAIIAHLAAVGSFLAQLGNSQGAAKVAQAQKAHLEQLLSCSTLSVADASKASSGAQR